MEYFAIVDADFDVPVSVGTAYAIAVLIGDCEVVQAGGDALGEFVEGE